MTLMNRIRSWNPLVRWLALGLVAFLAVLLLATLTACGGGFVPLQRVEVAGCPAGEQEVEVFIFTVHPAIEGVRTESEFSADILLEVGARGVPGFPGVTVAFDGNIQHPTMFEYPGIGTMPDVIYRDNERTTVDNMSICHPLESPVQMYVKATINDMGFATAGDYIECEMSAAREPGAVGRKVTDRRSLTMVDMVNAVKGQPIPLAAQCGYGYDPQGWTGQVVPPFPR